MYSLRTSPQLETRSRRAGFTLGELLAAVAWVLAGDQGGNGRATGPNWLCPLLNGVEQKALYRSMLVGVQATGGNEAVYNFADDGEHIGFGNYSLSVGQWIPEVFVCPSAPPATEALGGGVGGTGSNAQWGLEHIVKGNYAACWGADTFATGCP